MRNLLRAGLCCLLTLVAPLVAATEVQYLSISLSYQDDGGPEQKATAIVVPHKEAILTVQGDSPESMHRIRLNASPATVSSKGVPYSNVSVQFLKNSSDGWLVQSSLQVGAAFDMPATVSAPDELKGEASSGLKLTLTATPLTAKQVKAITGKSDLSIQDCPVEEAGSSSSSKSFAKRGGEPSCCRSPCNGSTLQMTCCGAVNCCACGTCCSPP